MKIVNTITRCNINSLDFEEKSNIFIVFSNKIFNSVNKE